MQNHDQAEGSPMKQCPRCHSKHSSGLSQVISSRLCNKQHLLDVTLRSLKRLGAVAICTLSASKQNPKVETLQIYEGQHPEKVPQLFSSTVVSKRVDEIYQPHKPTGRTTQSIVLPKRLFTGAQSHRNKDAAQQIALFQQDILPGGAGT